MVNNQINHVKGNDFIRDIILILIIFPLSLFMSLGTTIFMLKAYQILLKNVTSWMITDEQIERNRKIIELEMEKTSTEENLHESFFKNNE